MKKKHLNEMPDMEDTLDSIRLHARTLSNCANFAINHPDANARKEWLNEVHESLDYMATLKAYLIEDQAQEVKA